MGRHLVAGTCLAVLAGCGSTAESGGLRAGNEIEAVRVEARETVMVSSEPLSDVVNGWLKQGETATALCFVRKAQTMIGSYGSAIKLEAGDVSGYAAVTDFPDNRADRQMMFDLDDRELADRLPACRT